MNTVSAVSTIDKAVSVLTAIERSPHSLAELVDATGLPRATAHRLASALIVHGLVRRGTDGRFGLGPRLVVLGRSAEASLPLAAMADPALRELRSASGESVQLYVRDGESRVCVHALESPHGLRTIVQAGATLPLDRGSAGRALTGDLSSGGWVESIEEREPGVASVSAPVYAGEGEVIAAVSVSGPIERTSRRPGHRYGAEVIAAARAVERALAGS